MATRRVLSVRRAAAVLTVTLVSLAFLPSIGHADPQLTISEVQARVDHLYEEAEAATERAHEARIEVQATRDHLARVQKRLSEQRAELAELDQAMADYAITVYTSGGIDPTLQVMLSANPEDVLARSRSLDQVSRIQDAALRDAEVARVAMAQTQAEVDQDLARLKDQMAKLADSRQEANARLAEARKLLSSLKAEERARLAALQEQRAAASAQASRDAVRSIPTPTTSGSSSGRAGSAVSYALAQVGKPYVFGAAGPSSFDCSGLTMAAWAQAGVYLPHAASQQYAATARVSTSSLQPGDLVFFYSDIHHVGIYVGGGTFVHAANPGDGVVADQLFSSYWMSVFVGAGRV
ncbi:MAG: NlpC/P60 family protein [Actinomycetota bacterium]|nr:NlpC/P60 family protein [Actinomycetota bacterium]MDH4352482.1 NlpC/P60 family protein [Actinomycetota bacterium]MDH5278911.1 NlpC/P60 family protein [Actinomycetota bacterium]